MDELVRSNKEVLQAKLRLLKAENQKFLQIIQSSRVNQDLLGQKLIESQREAKGNSIYPLLLNLAEEIERQ